MSPLEAKGQIIEDSEFITLSQLHILTEIDSTVLFVATRDSKTLVINDNARGITVSDFPKVITELKKRKKQDSFTFPWKNTDGVWSLTRERRNKTTYTIYYYPNKR